MKRFIQKWLGVISGPEIDRRLEIIHRDMDEIRLLMEGPLNQKILMQGLDKSVRLCEDKIKNIRATPIDGVALGELADNHAKHVETATLDRYERGAARAAGFGSDDDGLAAWKAEKARKKAEKDKIYSKDKI